MKATVGITIGTWLFLLGSGIAARQEPGSEALPAPAAPAAPKAAAPAEPLPAFAWRRTARYDPPDFEGFFPDDPDGGRALDALMADENRGRRPATEILRTVHRGLRRTTAEREDVVTWIGSQFVWHAAPQNPLAIEILYHATDFRGPLTGYAESPSIYYGLMRVDPKTPAILHAVVNWCMHVENVMDWIWAGDIGSKDRALILSFIKPYLDSADAATRRRALVVEKYLRQSPDAGNAYAEWARERVQAKSGHRLAATEKALRSGDSRDRLAALKLIEREDMVRIMGESFVDPLRACAGDADPAVRRELPRILNGVSGSNWDRPWAGEIIDIVLRLSADNEPRRPLRRGVSRREEPLAGGSEGRHHPPARHAGGPRPAAGPDAANRLAAPARSRHRGPVARRDATRPRPRAGRGRPIGLQGADRPDPARVRRPSAPRSRKGYVAAFRDLYEHLGKVYPELRHQGDRLGEGRPRAAPSLRNARDRATVRPVGRGVGGAAGGQPRIRLRGQREPAVGGLPRVGPPGSTV